MDRRKFLLAAGAGSAISVFDWLRFFKANGVPGTKKELGIAEAAAQAAATPHYLIYWFIEGGWDGYSMFNPIVTRNDAPGKIGGLDAIYRPAGATYDGSGNYQTMKVGNITTGHLAEAGSSLFGDMSVISTHKGGTFHSGSRLNYHYGNYPGLNPQAKRATDERTVLQAFCEEYGSSFLLPHISWHRWLSDGELSEANYPEGTGYYEKLGPAYAHTLYGGTPQAMRDRLAQIQASKGDGRDARIHKFVDGLYSNFMKDKNSDTVKAFDSAVKIHQTLATKGSSIDPKTLFTDATLRSEFGIVAADEMTTSTSVNDMPARSKNSPNTNAQALMTFEMIKNNLSIGFWLESREVRGFDSHRSRQSVFNAGGQFNQKQNMDKNLWTPLKALVNRLKTTNHPATGKPFWDYTTIVLCSEMGRTMSGEDDDVCKHWDVSSTAFLGGTVKGGTQFGRVGTTSQAGIPILPTGALDPNFDPTTGALLAGKTQAADSFVSDAGHVYATSLLLSGITTPRGKNARPAMTFVKK